MLNVVISADTIPVVSLILALLHIGFIIPLIIVVKATTSKDYECDKKPILEAGLVGILTIFCISCLVEWIMFYVGLRGGPLEEKKRRLVRPLIYIEAMLLLLSILFSVWNNYLVQADSISQTCFASNPCGYASSRLESACISEPNSEDIEMTPACANIWENSKQYRKECFEPWFHYSTTWYEISCLRVHIDVSVF